MIRALSGDVLSEATAAVGRAADLDEACTALAEVIGKERPLDRVSVRRILPVEPAVLIVAVWSALPTKIGPGVRMSSIASSLPEVLRRDGPVVVENATPAPDLLDNLLTYEGLQSWVTVPLRQGKTIASLLSFSSTRPGAFTDGDAEFFARLGAAVEARMIALPPAAEDV